MRSNLSPLQVASSNIAAARAPSDAKGRTRSSANKTWTAFGSEGVQPTSRQRLVASAQRTGVNGGGLGGSGAAETVLPVGTRTNAPCIRARSYPPPSLPMESCRPDLPGRLPPWVHAALQPGASLREQPRHQTPVHACRDTWGPWAEKAGRWSTARHFQAFLGVRQIRLQL